MRFSLHWLKSRQGIILIAVSGVATLWLGATGQLGLYIHPRYNVFTLLACGAGVLAVIYAVNYEDHEVSVGRRRDSLPFIVVMLVAITSLLIIKPTTLSKDIATQRGVNSGANTEVFSKLANADIVSPFGGDSFLQLSVKDWAGLLSQTSDTAFFTGKQAKVSGFISKDTVSPNDRFFVSRFVVSCCAVDARPVGVPVYMPNWPTKYSEGQWVEVEGSFAAKQQRIGLDVDKITNIEQPRNPYVY